MTVESWQTGRICRKHSLSYGRDAPPCTTVQEKSKGFQAPSYFWICFPQFPNGPCKKGTHSTSFCNICLPKDAATKWRVPRRQCIKPRENSIVCKHQTSGNPKLKNLRVLNFWEDFWTKLSLSPGPILHLLAPRRVSQDRGWSVPTTKDQRPHTPFTEPGNGDLGAGLSIFFKPLCVGYVDTPSQLPNMQKKEVRGLKVSLPPAFGNAREWREISVSGLPVPTRFLMLLNALTVRLGLWKSVCSFLLSIRGPFFRLASFGPSTQFAEPLFLISRLLDQSRSRIAVRIIKLQIRNSYLLWPQCTKLMRIAKVNYFLWLYWCREDPWKLQLQSRKSFKDDTFSAAAYVG